VSEDDRCPNCGALVGPEAEWCGQCYLPLRRTPDPAPDPAPTEPTPAGAAPPRTSPDGAAAAARPPASNLVQMPGGGAVEIEAGHATWTCAVCGEVNPIELSNCVVCGTSFTRLFAEPEEAPSLDPEKAAVWSILFPGLGHWKLGRKADGVARMVLFLWTFGTLVLLLASRFGKGGLGPVVALAGLFAIASGALYVTSIVDAYRLARGDDPLVSSRVLLWSSAGFVLLTVLVATLVTLPAARGG
jgi:hypothetical protein